MNDSVRQHSCCGAMSTILNTTAGPHEISVACRFVSDGESPTDPIVSIAQFAERHWYRQGDYAWHKQNRPRRWVLLRWF